MQRLQATVRLDRAEVLPLVMADHIGIEQVLTNLLRNAADAMAGAARTARDRRVDAVDRIG